MPEFAAYAGLFVTALLAATLLPGSSELALTSLLATGYHPASLVAVATVGNVLGSTVNWLLGRFLLQYADRRWFPVSRKSYDRASAWFARFGVWMLLFAWLPIIGDPLTVVAGALGVRLMPFAILITIGKLARYAAIAAGATLLIQ